MKKRILILSIILCIIFTGYSFAVDNVNLDNKKDSVSDSVDNSTNDEEIPEVKPEVKINKTSATIVVGKTVALRLENTKDMPKWYTSNKTIAAVSSNGTVKGVKPGSATITAKVNGRTFVCKVKVEKPVINFTSRTLLKGYNYKMSFSGTTLKPTWKSSNTSIVTIDSNGKMSAKKKGSTTVKGTVGGVTYTCKIKVDAPYLNATSKSMIVGNKFQLKLSGSSRKVSWKTYSKSTATVTGNGLVRAKKAGTVKIAALTGGQQYICTVKIVNIGLGHKSLTMTKGNKYTLKTYGLYGTKKWSSSNKKVATVSSKGVITAKSKGTTTISVKWKGKTYKCTVKVEAPYMTVSKSTIIIGSNSTLKMYGTSKSYKWSTSNSSVATVNSKGQVTGKKAGTVYVYGIVDNRRFTYKITVKNPSTFSGWIEKSGKSLYYASGTPVTSWQTIGGKKYCFNDNGELISKFGIDVSSHNGNINWSKVKNAGVEFTFIRLGYRGYRTGKIVTDTNYRKNIEDANDNNIDCGVYFFTQATNAKEGIEEAQYVLKNIRGYDIDYPIVIDTEASGAEKNDGKADKISKLSRTLAIKAFCETIKDAGYTPMIYASKSWLNSKLDMSMLEEYDVWLAHYTSGNSITDYSGAYGIWQYTSSGRVDGISGRCDLNVAIKKY